MESAHLKSEIERLRRKEQLQMLECIDTLEERNTFAMRVRELHRIIEKMENEHHFDSGVTAGLKMAINTIFDN